MTPKTYVFDLDGTLCETSGTQYLDAVPYPDRIARVNQLFEDGHRIIIDTARGTMTGQIWHRATAAQLDRWGLKRHALVCGKKTYGDHYIDDKGINAQEFFDDADGPGGV